METPSRHSFNLNGSTRVFPVASPIKGDNYCRLEVDGNIINDRSKYDIVNNSIVFLNASDVPNGSQLSVLVVQSEEAIGQLAITTNIDIVASNIEDINIVGASITDVNTVASSITDVNTVATSISDVNDAYDNAQAAIAGAAAASIQAGLAADQAAASLGSATASATSAIASSNSATASASSAAAAAASATLAENYIPNNQGHAGKYLATDGELNFWEFITLDAVFPDQSGNEGKILKTDGATVSWEFDSLANLEDTAISSPVSGQQLTYNGAEWVNKNPNTFYGITSVNNGLVLHTEDSADVVAADYATWTIGSNLVFSIDKNELVVNL